MERCFSCAEIGTCTELYVRKPADYHGPYFPIFERFNPPSNSNSISPEGTVKVCALCRIYLQSQWHNYESQGAPESRRMYFTKRHDAGIYNGSEQQQQYQQTLFGDNCSVNKQQQQPQFTWSKSSSTNDSSTGIMKNIIPHHKSPLSVPASNNGKSSDGILDDFSSGSVNTGVNTSKQMTEHHISCFVCGQPCLKWHAKTAYSSQVLENKEYFPFFEKLDPPHLSIGLTNGATKICIQCENDLLKQWDHYEKLGTDQDQRTYHITNDHNNPFSVDNPGRFVKNSIIKSQLYVILKSKNIKCALCLNTIIDPYQVTWNSRVSSLYIPSLKNFPFSNDGVMVDKSSEEAIICDVCHYFLSFQTQQYDSNMTAFHMREYKLPKIGLLSSPIIVNEKLQPTNIKKPLSIGGSSSAFSPAEGWQLANSQSKRSKSPGSRCQSDTPTRLLDQNRNISNSKFMKTSQDSSSGCQGPIIANCHICLQELRDPKTLKMLRADSNDDAPEQPYFPFLKTLRQNAMKNFEFPVCLHCYCNMHGQWKFFQNSSVPVFERKFTHTEFMCTQCQRLYPQKMDTSIVRDRLVCIGCSESVQIACDNLKTDMGNAFREAEDNAHNSFTRTKTTVTVTPISNELSVSNFSSASFAETMKHLTSSGLNKTSLNASNVQSGSNGSNVVNHFADYSRSSSISSEMYSKSFLGKTVKRTAVAAVAPNQRQNTPIMPSESLVDMRLKLPEMFQLGHNSAFSTLNTNVSKNHSSFPGFPLNSPFDREGFMKNSAIHNTFIDQKPRINASSATNPNPFISWQQHHQKYPQVLPEYNSLPLQNRMTDMVSNMYGNDKDAEMLLWYWMYQKQLQQNPDNSWMYYPIMEMMSNYQSAMAGHAMPGQDERLSMNNGIAANNGMSNSSTGSGNLHSWLMNALCASYQYQQLMQMLTAQHMSINNNCANPQPAINSLKPPVPNFLSQHNPNDSSGKQIRLDAFNFDSMFPNRCPTALNGSNDTRFMMNPLAESDNKLLSNKSSFHSTPVTNYLPNSGRETRISNHSKISTSIEVVEKQKPIKSEISDVHTSSKTKDCDSINTSEKDDEIKSQPKCKDTVFFSQAEVLDLSQSKSPRRSSYAIDSITDHNISVDSFSQNSQSFQPMDNHYNREIWYKLESDVVKNPIEKYTDMLKDLGAFSLIDVLHTIPESSLQTKLQQKRKLSFKCPTIRQLQKIFSVVDRWIVDSYNSHLSSHTRQKKTFLSEVGLEEVLTSKLMKSLERTTNLTKDGARQKSKKSKFEKYWEKWVLKHLNRRFCLTDKPHLRRSLMRPVLSNGKEVRFCAAKNKHELESLRNIIKIIIKYA